MHGPLDTRTFGFVFAGLIALTLITVGVSLVDLGTMNTWVALAVASTKAGLVLFYFMDLREADGLTRAITLGALATLMIMFGGILNDDVHRTVQRFLPAGEIRAVIDDLRVLEPANSP